MNAPSGSLIAYSTAPGKTALDGGGRNSPYTSALLRHIGTPNITVIQMFQRVRSTVMDKSGNQQTPWESTSMRGDFYFTAKGSGSNQEVEVASVPSKPSSSRPTSSTSNIIQRDGIYVAYANGIVKDTNTGLEWKVGPNKHTNWNEARSWVQSLNLDGGGWRMPTIDELEGLYKKGSGSRNMTSLLKTTGWYVWSGETEGSSDARDFTFNLGLSYWRHRDYSRNGRAFAVRSRGDG